MSWHYSRALVGAYLQRDCSDGLRFARSKATGTDGTYCYEDKTTGTLAIFPSGTTSGPSTALLGEAVSMWFREGFPARPIPRQLEVALSRTTYGRKCGESWQRQLPGTYLPRTPLDWRSIRLRTTSKRWVTKPTVLRLLRQIWERRMSESGTGYVHTPTTKANYAAASMQKWKSCRLFVSIYGKPEPATHEYLMGLANRMDRFEATGNGQVPIVAATAWRLMSSQSAKDSKHG